MTDRNAAILRMMTYAMLADGEIAEAEITHIQSTYSTLAGVAIDRDAVLADAALAKKHEAGEIVAFLESAHKDLSPADREILLTAGFRVAKADGEITSDELFILSVVAQSLDIDRERFNEIFAQVEG